jgi:hypothetical protein
MKFVRMIFSVIILLSISSCGKDNIEKPSDATDPALVISSPEPKKEDENVFTANGLSIIDSKSNQYILLGMNKEDVDKLLGEQQNKDFRNVYEYQGLEVFYRDNKVAGLIISASINLTNRFKTSNQISLGKSRDDILKAYGDYTKGSSGKMINYAYEYKDNSLTKLNEFPKNNEANISKKLYCVSYLLFDNGKVNMILISDYEYAVSGK